MNKEDNIVTLSFKRIGKNKFKIEFDGVRSVYNGLVEEVYINDELLLKIDEDLAKRILNAYDENY